MSEHHLILITWCRMVKHAVSDKYPPRKVLTANRLMSLKKDKRSFCVAEKTAMKKRRVLHLYKEMIPSAMLCGHIQLEALAAQELIEYRHCPAGKVRKEALDWAEIVVLCRLDNSYERRLAQLLKSRQKCIIYVIDDDLLNIPAELSSGAYYARPDIRSNICSMIAMSDAVISPSPILLSKYAKNGKKGILLEEPAINPMPYMPHEPGKPIRIGFAGSIDRVGDIESILREALLHIKDEYGKSVEFVFYGAVPSCATELEAECIPYSSSYEEYRKTMNALQLDIGLAPMPDTDFHACKHYNKFIEYAAANTVGIFSNVSPYDRLADQVNWELMCDNTAVSWCVKIKELLDNSENLERLKKRVAILADTQFSVSASVQPLEKELLQMQVHSTNKSIQPGVLTLIRIGALLDRLMRIIKHDGKKRAL